MEWVYGRRLGLPGLAVLACLVILAALCSTASVRAQVTVPQGTQGLISLNVVDADLSQVVRILMSESKQSIVIGDPDARQKKVTAMLNNVSLETALRYVVESVGCSWKREADGVYVVGAKSLVQSGTSNGTQPALADSSASIAARATSGVNEASHRETRVEMIKLYNASPADMMWTLGVYNLDNIAKIQSKQPQNLTVYKENADGTRESVFLPEQTTPMTESLKAAQNVAERAPQYGTEAAQRPYQQQQQQQYQQNQPRPPGQPQAGGTNQQGGGLLPAGIDYVLTYDLDNSLIVRGDDEGIEELKTIISKLDIAPRQIMIEARFVSIATNDLEALGVNWSLERLNNTFSTQFNPAGNILIGYANGNVIASLRAQLGKSHGKLINAPIVTTMNNVPASIGFSTSVPYLTSSTQFNQNGGASTASATMFLQVTSQLWVLPRINNADNSITVNIMPQISDIESYVDTANGSVPIVSSQFIQTQRRVANGETIVLGGLIRKDDNISEDKIPLIGDLPIIGRLFKSTKTTVNDKELLIFLTPTIVNEKPVAGSGIGVTP